MKDYVTMRINGNQYKLVKDILTLDLELEKKFLRRVFAKEGLEIKVTTGSMEMAGSRGDHFGFHDMTWVKVRTDDSAVGKDAVNRISEYFFPHTGMYIN